MSDPVTFIKRALLRLSIDPSHIGFSQLLDSVFIRVSSHSDLDDIFSSVARTYNVNPRSVKRNISYALSRVDDLHIRFSNLLGFSFSPDSLHLSNIIIYLAEFVLDPSIFSSVG